jgi:DNA polymerase-3 subunit alpha
MATFQLEDLGAVVEVMVFPRVMAEHGHVLEEDSVVCIRGRVDQRDDRAKIIALEITSPDLAVDDGDAPVRVRARLATFSDARVAAFKDLLVRHPGNRPVFVHLDRPEKTTVIRLGDEFRVEATNGLFAEMRELLGADCLL